MTATEIVESLRVLFRSGASHEEKMAALTRAEHDLDELFKWEDLEHGEPSQLPEAR